MGKQETIKSLLPNLPEKDFKLAIKFFEYKGHIGANSDLENGKFLNDPKAPGQLGVISLVENIGLPDEVKLLILKKYKCKNHALKIERGFSC